ncbi:hypothetical protein SNOUR_27425 [Streptomyces noursei ATCC 11455]|nr:hypothetical protein SNOUR_27425 [Streptomyces noursei ATCC 11455]
MRCGRMRCRGPVAPARGLTSRRKSPTVYGAVGYVTLRGCTALRAWSRRPPASAAPAFAHAAVPAPRGPRRRAVDGRAVEEPPAARGRAYSAPARTGREIGGLRGGPVDVRCRPWAPRSWAAGIGNSPSWPRGGPRHGASRTATTRASWTGSGCGRARVGRAPRGRRGGGVGVPGLVLSVGRLGPWVVPSASSPFGMFFPDRRAAEDAGGVSRVPRGSVLAPAGAAAPGGVAGLLRGRT